MSFQSGSRTVRAQLIDETRSPLLSSPRQPLRGLCGLNHWEPFDETELGWTLKAEAWGRGYATEAARACLEWGFANLDAPYFTAMSHPANSSSIRVAERLGFSPLRDDVLLDKPVTVYSLSRPGLSSEA